MNTNILFTTFLVIAVVVYGITRQISEKEVKRFAFLIFPLVCVYQTYVLLPRTSIPRTELIQCLIAVVIGFLASVLQALFTRVYYKEDQKLYMKGGLATLMIWIASIFLRMAVKVVFEGAGAFTAQQGPEWISFAGLAVTFASRSFILHLRYPEIKEYLERAGEEKRSLKTRKEGRHRRSRRR